MPGPAAVIGDKATGVCVHIVMVPSPGGLVPTPLPHPYAATIVQGEPTVLIGNRPAATVTSACSNLPPHIPTPPGVSFGPPPPTNDGRVVRGSVTVLIGGKPAARIGDSVMACTTGSPPTMATIVGPGVPTVIVGG
jgi:uncharacterized Zn-binding protein involved in type VI secretion